MTALVVVAAAMGVLASTALLAAVVGVVWWLDRYDREPLQLVAAAFVWGACVAPLLALAAASVVSPRTGHGAVGALVAAALEELVKGVVVVLIARHSADFDTPTDGLVYGTAAGLGFAAAENAIYTLAGVAAGPSVGLLAVVAQRTLFTAGVHGLASGVVGGCVGLAYLTRGAFQRVGWMVAGLAAGTLLHGGWNLALVRTTTAGRQWPLLAAIPLLSMLYLAAFASFLRWEHSVLRRELEDEARLRLVPSWVPAVIPFYRRRIRPEWWPRRAERVVLSRLLTRLAFRKFQVSRLPEGEASLATLEIVRLRTRVRCMLAPAGESPQDEIVKPM